MFIKEDKLEQGYKKAVKSIIKLGRSCGKVAKEVLEQVEAKIKPSKNKK